jgi:hypothetical protein
MTSPRDLVTRSYTPVARLQLHRLSERVRFHCAECGQDRTEGLIATIGGDWAKTVCNSCYESLVRERKARRAKKRELAQAKQRRRKSKPTGQVETRPKPSDEWEQQLRRQFPGVDRLLAFFRDAGIRVEVRRGGLLRVDDQQTQPLPRITLPSDWDNVIDEIAVKYTSGRFINAVTRNTRTTLGTGIRPVLLPKEKGIAITRHGLRLMTIHATRAHIPQRGLVHGNFLMPGPHWQQVADVLHSAEAERVARRRREQEAKAAMEPAAGARLDEVWSGRTHRGGSRTPPPQEAPRPRSRTTGSPNRRVTPQKEFRPFILQILREASGVQQTYKVLDEIERRMAHIFVKGDYAKVSDGEVRWTNAARWERKAMVDDGLIKATRDTDRRGVWQLTRRGMEGR